MKHSYLVAVAVCATVFAVACGDSPATPTSPSASAAASSATVANGEELKATAPQLQSPGNGSSPPAGDITFVIVNATYTDFPGGPGRHRFELVNSAGTQLFQGDTVVGSGTTTSLLLPQNITFNLTPDATYRWRARAFCIPGDMNCGDTTIGRVGPWSAFFSFVAPNFLGYNVAVAGGGELYDPLLTEATVGDRHGPMHYVPGKGYQLDSRESWIEYVMKDTCRQCEFSAILNNIHSVSATEDPKDSVISAKVGRANEGAFNDNAYRLSVDKRGNNAVAWRFITGDTGNYIETLGSGERPVVNFRSANQYFVEAKWRNQQFTVTYRENGPTGAIMYQGGKPYGREYRPNPLVAYAGRPWLGGQRGEPSTVEGMIIRQIWFSPNPRPSFANR